MEWGNCRGKVEGRKRKGNGKEYGKMRRKGEENLKIDE